MTILLPFDAKAATHYARLRCDRSLEPPDAACAAATRVDLFVANDQRLQSKRVDGIQFMTFFVRRRFKGGHQRDSRSTSLMGRSQCASRISKRRCSSFL